MKENRVEKGTREGSRKSLQVANEQIPDVSREEFLDGIGVPPWGGSFCRSEAWRRNAPRLPSGKQALQEGGIPWKKTSISEEVVVGDSNENPVHKLLGKCYID